MNKSFYISKFALVSRLFFSVAFLGISSQSVAQISDTSEDAGSSEDKVQNKIKKHSNKKLKDASKKSKNLNLENKDNQKHLAEMIKKSMKENLFPSWPVPKFDCSLEPVAGFELRSFSSAGKSYEVATTEFGLQAGMTGLPYAPNNPGVVGSISLGGTYGAQGELESDDKNIAIESYSYKRYWGHVGVTFLMNQFKDTLKIKRGILDASGDIPTLSSYGFTNDFGVLFYTWVSGHYTLDYDIVEKAGFDDTYLTEIDHWFHARIFTDVASAYFDFGPGFTDSEQNTLVQVGDQTEKLKTKQFTSYFLVNTGLNPFWKLVAKARAKYIFDASGDTLLTDSSETSQLPDQNLNEPKDTGIPADSIQVSSFIGFDNLFSGFGIGYQLNLTILNLNEKDGTVKQTTRQQGLGMVYTANF